MTSTRWFARLRGHVFELIQQAKGGAR